MKLFNSRFVWRGILLLGLALVISGGLMAQTPSLLFSGPSITNSDFYLNPGAPARCSDAGLTRSAGVPLNLFTPDFSFSVSDPQTVDPAVTNQVNFTYSVTYLGGFSGTVSVSIDNTVYNFASPYLNPASFTSSGGGTLTLILPAGVAPGTYTITLTATGGGISHVASTSLTILDDSCC